MSQMDPKFSKKNHLSALRSIHKMNKLRKKKKREKSQISDSKSIENKIEEVSELITGNSVQGSKRKPILKKNLLNLNKKLKKSFIEKSDEDRQRKSKKKLDIAITLQSYNVHLKKAEDKHYFTLRQNFSRSLAKLGSLDTRDIGMREIQSIITKNKNPRTVRLVLSMLNKSRNISSNLCKEAEILLLGFMIRAFGSKLFDILDKKLSFEKTIYRVLELVLSHFNTTNMAIRRACAKTWVDSYGSFIDFSDDKKYFFLIKNLVSVIQGGAMVAAQQTATQVLLDVIRFAKECGDEKLIELGADDCYELFLLSKNFTPNIVRLVGFIAKYSPFSITANYLYAIFRKITEFLEDSEIQKKSNLHKTKKEICEFLRILGKILLRKLNNFIGINVEFLIKKLESLSRDRVLKVQLKAKEALKVWKHLEKKLENLDEKKMKFQEIDEDQLLKQKFTGKKIPQSLDDSLEKLSIKSKSSSNQILPSINSNTNLNSLQRGINVYKKNNIVEKTYLKQKALNFQKKRSGTGGGYIDKIDRFNKKKKKPTYNTIRERLKQQVLQDKIDFSKLRKSQARKKFELVVKEKVNQVKKERSKEKSIREEKSENQTFLSVDGEEVAEQEDEVVPQRENKLESIKEASNRFESINTSYKGDDDEEEVFEKQDIKDETENIEQEEIKIVENHSSKRSESERMMSMGKEPSFNKSIDVGVQVESPEEIYYEEGEEEFEGTEDFADTNTIEETEVINSHTIQIAKQFDPSKARFKNPAISNKVSLEDTIKMMEEHPENGLDSTRYYQENGDEEYYQSLADTVAYLRPEEEDLDPTVYYGSTDEEDDELEANVITFQRPRHRQKEKKPLDQLSIAWNQALYLLDLDRVNEAYRLILLTNDDFYLLRLMAKTGVCFNKLEYSVKESLKSRVNELKKSEFINDLVDEFDREASKLEFQEGRKKGSDKSVTFDFSSRSKIKSDRTDFQEARVVLESLKGRIGYVHPPQKHGYDGGN